ncbi:beta-N-acetylhexosaminidase [Halobacillus salinarum]|uniref:beta-N-acetylhexosaminidase n=1 Tax=Halobacillus salinarum TaxID=2932257 RepID=A0ABY4EFL6_9BACI|nr:beta-N-acetylhexosaminidase [Halobacillus salinarum]UOQ42837.1 beta-N-acetylhexosaminidase [Halobacillus salinarum]
MLNENGNEKETGSKDVSEPKTEKNHHKELINKIFHSSKEGKVEYVPFVIGQADKNDAASQWGKPDRSSRQNEKIYEDYNNKEATLGYKYNLLVDIRSHSKDLHKIRYEDLKKVKGDPDEVHYYKDDTHNQIILYYQVQDQYQLKWILPKPTDAESNPRVDHVSLTYTDTEHEADALISKMSLEEKIGQMIIAGTDGTSIQPMTRKLVDQYKVGGLIFYSVNLTSPSQTVKLLNQMKESNKPNRFPLLLSTDQEGGRVTRLPGNLVHVPTNQKIGNLNNPSYSKKVGQALGKEMKAYGFNLDYAPVLDVNSNPDNPVIGDRSFGDDPQLVAKLGTATMEGLQTQNIIPVIKHFPGHGDTSVDSHLELPKVNKTLTQLQQLELIPFKQAVNQGADVVMVAHILIPELDGSYPSSMSKNMITGILRDNLGYNGVIMTDDMTMKAITNHYHLKEAAIQSIRAGNDIILIAHGPQNAIDSIEAIKRAVKQGDLSEERINQSVKRIIQLKMKYGLTDEKSDQFNLSDLNQSLRSLLQSSQ